MITANYMDTILVLRKSVVDVKMFGAVSIIAPAPMDEIDEGEMDDDEIEEEPLSKTTIEEKHDIVYIDRKTKLIYIGPRIKKGTSKDISKSPLFNDGIVEGMVPINESTKRVNRGAPTPNSNYNTILEDMFKKNIKTK